MKTAASQVLLATLAMGSVVPRGRKHHGIGKDDFIKVDGLRLYDSKGALHYLTGTYFNIRSTVRTLLTENRDELLGMHEPRG